MASILIAGDYCPRERVQTLINEGAGLHIFDEVTNIITQCDYSVVNFETVVALKDDKPINKMGIHLKTTEDSIALLKSVGFNMITLANNHALDYGTNALIRTIQLSKKYELDHIGAGASIGEARNIIYKTIDKIIFAFINACEEEFSIASEDKAGCNPINTITIVRCIREAKINSDRVILILHGGNEHYQYPSPRMKEQYRFFVEMGADVVVNHHQHCFSGYEYYNEKLIVYGVGNFCFDSESEIKIRSNTFNYGYLAKIKIDKKNIFLETIPYEQCKSTPKIRLLQNKQVFEKKLNEINTIIQDDKLLEVFFEKYALSIQKDAFGFLRPYTNRVFTSLYYRGFFPGLFSPDQVKTLLSKLKCQSHLDVLLINCKNNGKN